MIILGIHAGHSASATLMRDGVVCGMIQEERLTGRKNQTGFPKRAIERLVAIHLDGDFEKIDRIGYGSLFDSIPWTGLNHYSDYGPLDFVRQMHEYWYPKFYGTADLQEEVTWTDEYWYDKIRNGEELNEDHNFDLSFLNSMTGQEAFDHFNQVERREAVKRHFDWRGKVDFIEHHTCHSHWALWGNCLSPEQRKDALILTGDSRGDDSNWTVSVLNDNGDIERIAGGLDNVVARIYKYATLVLGMKPNEHEYKVMGLASYSQSPSHIKPVEQIFYDAVDFRDGEFINDKPLIDSYFDLKNRLDGHRFDNIAAGLQNWCTGVTAAWVKHWLKETGKRGVCFSGGLSMNIKTNGELALLDELDWLSVPASGGDESLSAGACFVMADTESRIPVEHVYLGETPDTPRSEWFSKLGDSSLTADDFGLFENLDVSMAAKLLADDIIIARCVGPSEFGARALGNRSILANPANGDNLQKINTAIKHRDFWMPFTPSILAEHTNEYLENDKNITSPYMTIGYQTQVARQDEIVAALHPSDKSARPQFVDRNTNPEYWALIDAFRNITGIPALLNTSLNLHGEPMNYAIEDAIHTLAESDLEFLLIPGNQMIYKRAAKDRMDDALRKFNG